MEDLESAIRAARDCNGCADEYDWRDADPPALRITAKTYAIAVALAAALALVIYPFHS